MLHICIAQKAFLQTPCYMLQWLLKADGMKDLRKHSILHCGSSSLLLKELLRTPTVWCRRWEGFYVIDASLANVLLSPTSLIVSREQSNTELALLTSLLSLFLSLSELPKPQQQRALQMHPLCRKKSQSQCPLSGRSLVRLLWPL